jgi:hypothetical protein
VWGEPRSRGRPREDAPAGIEMEEEVLAGMRQQVLAGSGVKRDKISVHLRLFITLRPYSGCRASWRAWAAWEWRPF